MLVAEVMKKKRDRTEEIQQSVPILPSFGWYPRSAGNITSF